MPCGDGSLGSRELPPTSRWRERIMLTWMARMGLLTSVVLEERSAVCKMCGCLDS